MDKLSIHARCTTTLHMLHKSSKKWLVFGPPQIFTPTCQFFYTDISVISIFQLCTTYHAIPNNTGRYHTIWRSTTPSPKCSSVIFPFLFGYICSAVDAFPWSLWILPPFGPRCQTPQKSPALFRPSEFIKGLLFYWAELLGTMSLIWFYFCNMMVIINQYG